MPRWLICLFALLSLPAAAAAQSCSGSGLAVQVLGSGAQIKPDRASASYLLWVDVTKAEPSTVFDRDGLVVTDALLREIEAL